MRSIWLRTFFMGIAAIAILVNFSSVFAGSCSSCPPCTTTVQKIAVVPCVRLIGGA
jgi:hypothetical protein